MGFKNCKLSSSATISYSKVIIIVLCLLVLLVALSDARRSKNRRRYRGTSRFKCEESQEDLDRLKAIVNVKCNCPSIYAPVCGSDGITYHNRCFIHCATQERYQGFHKGKRLTVHKMEACDGDH